MTVSTPRRHGARPVGYCYDCGSSIRTSTAVHRTTSRHHRAMRPRTSRRGYSGRPTWAVALAYSHDPAEVEPTDDDPPWPIEAPLPSDEAWAA